MGLSEVRGEGVSAGGSMTEVGELASMALRGGFAKPGALSVTVVPATGL